MRSQGQVRFVRISGKLQMIAAALVAAVACAWLAAMALMLAAQFGVGGERASLQAREAKVARVEGRVSAYRHDVDHVAADLERRQALIEQMVEGQLGELPAAEPADPAAQAARTVAQVSALIPGAADLARIEARQTAFVDRLTRLADARATQAETAIRRLGLNPRMMLARMSDTTAQGGPLLGVDPSLAQLGRSLARMGALEQGLAAVPHNLPASLEYISSGFGYRSDPFTGEAAFHSGLDFRGPVGAPIFAAAKGRVSFAGVKSGYGNCIEISHGNGMVTRYAHRSAFRAHVGQDVAAGEAIGAIGSTGRSTGPHLHFEVRINDRPVNPRPFLEATADVAQETHGRSAALGG